MKDFLSKLRKANTVVIDLETNSLDAFGYNSRILGYALYLPEHDEGAYFPFNHGSGSFEVSYTARNAPTTAFHDMTWQGDTKKAIWLNYWWGKWRRDNPEVFGNLPLELETQVVEALNDSGQRNATWVLHNAQFDLSWLANKGIKISDNVFDTMIGMHVVHEDMRGVKVDAPYRWGKGDYGSGKCKEEQVGQWARDAAGELLVKPQFGNYQLKWLCAFLGFEGATEGEDALHNAAHSAVESLASYIADHAEDAYNAGFKQSTLKQEALNKLTGYLDKKANMWTIPANGVAYYAQQDTKLTWRLYEWINERLAGWDNLPLFKQQCDILRHVTWPAYYNGVRLDVGAAEAEKAALAEKQEDLHQYMREMVGLDDFNPASNPQIMKALNSGLLENMPQGTPEWWNEELRAKLTTYKNVRVSSASVDALEDYDGHPFVIALLEYRKLGKAIGTYLSRWLENRDGNGIIHPSLNITGTVSGRLSSSGEAGNFQNIPDRNGYEMKRALVPLEAGYKIVGIDYGQLELRLATWLAEGVHGFDKSMPMTTLFEAGTDMHAYTRDQINVRDIVYPNMSDREIMTRLGYNLGTIPEADWAGIISGQCRFMAKTMNFGLLYGGGAGMLSKLLGIDKNTAAVLVASWRSLYPAFQMAGNYYADLAQRWRPQPCKDTLQQYVTQPFTKRHRRFSLYDERVEMIDPKTGVKQVWNEREQQARKAWNNVVQGLGGEMAKYAALEIVRKFPQVKVFNIVHDSIDLFVPENELSTIIPACKAIMQDWPVRPGLTTDVVVGDNWQDVQKWRG